MAIDTTKTYKNVKYENTTLKTYSNTGETININTNANNIDVRGYDTANVSVSGGGAYTLQDYLDDNGTADYLFYYSYIPNLSSVIANLNTVGITSMSNMFARTSATSITIPNTLYTSTVSTMRYMFNYSSASTINIGNIITNSLTDVYGMFANCSNLTSLDLSLMRTPKLTNMGNMFYYCTNLTNVNLSNWDTSKVTTTSYLFANCPSLTSITFPTNMNLGSCTNLSYMFSSCTNLTSVDFTNVPMTTASTSYMFRNCSNIRSIRLPNYTGPISPSDSSNMFSGCTSLITLDIRSWDLQGYSASALTSIFGSSSTGVPRNCSIITKNNNSKYTLMNTLGFNNVTYPGEY